MDKLDYMQSVQKRSGLSVNEFTQLLPISRAAWYDWIAGGGYDQLRYNLTLARIKRIEQLIFARELPVSKAIPKKERLTTVISLLQKP